MLFRYFKLIVIFADGNFFRQMKPFFWIVFLIISSVLLSFSTENEGKSLPSPIERNSLQDDVFLGKSTTNYFSEMPVCPLNFNVRTGNKTNLLKKWSRHGNALSLCGNRSIKQKYVYKLEKGCHVSLFSYYDNRFYVYYLRKLLL